MQLKVIGIAFLAFAMIAARRPPAVKVVVIVNSANPVTTMRREQIARMFLREVPAWNNGEEILPVDQLERSPSRATFAREVEGQTVSSLKIYWQQRIFSGNESPPPERVSDADVLTYVRSNAGAIGYVVEGTDLGTGVKAVVITETSRDAAR
jgi:ABC-type phosphate transport system substrate-binding protein